MKIKINIFSTKMKTVMTISTMLIVLFAFNQCVSKSGKKSYKSKSTYKSIALPEPYDGDASDIESDRELPEGMDMPEMNSPVEHSEMEALNVGVKNFDQINASMSRLTGVPQNDPAVMIVYNDLATQLPSDNDVKTLSPSMQVAITKLATEYCDRLVETDTYRVKIWTTINFNQSPTQTLNFTNKVTLINQTVEHFLGPIPITSVDQVKVELLSLYDTLLAGEDMNSMNTTKKVVKGVCIASLGSAFVSLL